MTLPTTFDEFHEPSLFDVEDPSTDEESETKEIDPDEVLGDLADIVGGIFRTWESDGEEKWAAHAYLSLKREGLVSEGDGADYTRNGVLLCAIWALSKEFYVRAFDEGSCDDWTYETPDVIGDFPKLSPLSIGRLAECEGVYADVKDGEESPYDVLKELIRAYAPAVAAALRTDLSDTWLLPYMWAIPTVDVVFPLPDDHDAWGELHHPSDNALEAYAWIVDGMPL